MSSIARPPDPCLVAIILIVRSRTGPRLVFHYPPNPLSENRLKTTTKGGRRISRARRRQGAKGTDSSSSDDSSVSSDEDEEERESHPGGSSMQGGRRASNFGLDDHASVTVSPAGVEPQRPGSLGSGRGSSMRKRTGASSDQEEDPGRHRIGQMRGLEARRGGPGSLSWGFRGTCGRSFSARLGHGINGGSRSESMTWP